MSIKNRILRLLPLRFILPEKNKYSGYIIIRLDESYTNITKDCDTLLDVVKKYQLLNLSGILGEDVCANVLRVVQSLEPGDLLIMEAKASKTSFPPLHSLTCYWRLDVRNMRIKKRKKLIKKLNNLDEVDLAYQEYAVSEYISVDPTTCPSGGSHLNPSREGIDAEWAFPQTDCRGAGVKFVDVEDRWYLDHEDLPFPTPAPIPNPMIIHGENRNDSGFWGNHGTAVLGIIAAIHNTINDRKGIAPGLTEIMLSSHYKNGHNLYVTDAIVTAIAHLDPGDVLLLEVQRNYKPTEIEPMDFDAIRLAVAHEIIVIEAAGNGDVALDGFGISDQNGIETTRLNRSDIETFQDSGSIMVGAAFSNDLHKRFPGGIGMGSNYGSRIDCYAWGECIKTCGYGPEPNPNPNGYENNENPEHYGLFGGTSGASAIIAGAAIVVQGKYKTDNPGFTLSPLQMRGILSDPLNGTSSGDQDDFNIGVMPDLKKILENGVITIPDIYLRDNINDIGTVPYEGVISISPDIIVLPQLVNLSDLGYGSGTENDYCLGYRVEAGQDNYIYIRAKNKGSMDAIGVKATIYWSEVSTLVTPPWNKIEESSPFNIPMGENLIVHGPIVWKKDDIPQTGHYCFVAVLDHNEDPAPAIPNFGLLEGGPYTIQPWDAFCNLIRNNNNISWRNFNVIDLNPDIVIDPGEFDFFIEGAPDIERIFDFQIATNFHDKTTIWLELPENLYQNFSKGDLLKPDIIGNKTARLPLSKLSKVNIPKIKLKKSQKINAKFIIDNIKTRLKHGDQIAVIQLFNNEEVGRITWQFADRRKK